MNKIRVIYLGYDIETVYLINSNPQFELIGVACIQELLTTRGNIFNYIFCYAYNLKIRERHFSLQIFLTYCLVVISPLLSQFNRRYIMYLKYLIRNHIPILCDDKSIVGHKSDIIIVNNWWKISNTLLNSPKYGCVNIHPSCLPKYRGSLPTLWSLKNKDNFSAVSFFLLDNKIDSGKILTQHQFNINLKDNALNIEVKIEQIVNDYLLNDILRYIKGEILPYEQGSIGVSYTAKYYEYMLIDFKTEMCADVLNKVMLYPYLNPIDLCYFYFKGHKIQVRNCKKYNMYLEPGAFLVKNGYIYAGCNNGSCVAFKLFKDINVRQSLCIISNK